MPKSLWKKITSVLGKSKYSKGPGLDPLDLIDAGWEQLPEDKKPAYIGINPMESINIADLVHRLASDEESVVKMAAFKLQSSLGDPSFAEVFILEGGLMKLQNIMLRATGHTLAYSLTAFSRLLDVDKGWDIVTRRLIERMVDVVVTQPLPNILRGAMAILTYVVSHLNTSSDYTSESESFGLDALKPIIASHPQFLQMLVTRLSSADHALCANALQLINSLMREAMTNESEFEWPRLIKKLQELGVINAVYALMQSPTIQDLSHPLFEYQALTKVLLRKWRDTPVDLEKPDHRRALKIVNLASNPDRPMTAIEDEEDLSKKSHNPEKWRRLGFESEHPAWDFEAVGYLGMMDLIDYVKKHEDGFQKLLLEQSTKPIEQRCPIAKTSLAITDILSEHFQLERAELDDTKVELVFDSQTNIDKVFKPAILQWSVLHSAAMQAFFRLWQKTRAESSDFLKIFDLVRILVEAVVGGAERTTKIQDMETRFQEFELERLRGLQMELLSLTYEDTAGHHLHQIQDELNYEALQFIKEQRIRCLLAGAWFPNPDGNMSETDHATDSSLKPKHPSYCYARLANNRRYLHYGGFDVQGDTEPAIEDLHEKIEMKNISSVTSNISAPSAPNSSTSTLKLPQKPAISTKITISGYLPSHSSRHTAHTPSKTPHTRNASTDSHLTAGTDPQHHPRKEVTLLTLHPQTHSLASEWIDGLLMLLNQQPITAETSQLVATAQDWGLKVRLLNVRLDDPSFVDEQPEFPSREGLDEDYYYEIAGG